MAKRSNDGSDADESSRHDGEDIHHGVKRKKITFEPVRLPAVSNVNDINSRTRHYQAVKIGQHLKYQAKKINEIERENERLKRRQETDENNFYRMNRHSLDLESQLMSAARSECDIDNKLQMEEQQIATSELLQLDPERFEEYSGKKRARMIKIFNLYSQARQKRAEKQKHFIKKMTVWMESSSPSTSDESVKELVAYNNTLSQENCILVAENARLQQEASDARSKFREKEGECEIALSKIEELTKELEDAKFEADKNLRLSNKFEHRLYTITQELKSKNSEDSCSHSSSSKKMNGQANGSPGEVSNKEFETLRSEKDEQADLASRRLQEINDLNVKLQRYSSELNKIKAHDSNIISSDAIMNSDEYKNLKKYYAMVMKEYERISKELDDVITERDRLRTSWSKRLESVKEEYDQAKLKIVENTEKINEESQATRRMYDVLRTEFEQALSQSAQSMNEAKDNDIKSILSSMKSQNHVLKQEVAKYKKKWRDAVSVVSKTQRECDQLKKKIESSLVIALDCDETCREDTLASPDPVREESDDASGLISNNSTEKELQRLKKENETLLKEIKALANADRAERQRFFERELQNQIGQKLTEMEKMKMEIERFENTEKALSEELESIGQALEELQEQNGALISSKQDVEDNTLKMMNERIVNNQICQKLKEKNIVLEDLNQKENQNKKLLEFEIKSLKIANEKYGETLELKTLENSRLTSALESHRKMLQEIGLSRDDLQIRNEKSELQLKHNQEILSQTSKQVEVLLHKKNRIQEEYDILRKKYERVQKSEKYGSTDAVLNEENRQLKEILTCPSCKTKPKDCIMLKCFHFFCESCIKTRYDTRQRKCPKCNLGFGANDFHRAFL